MSVRERPRAPRSVAIEQYQLRLYQEIRIRIREALQQARPTALEEAEKDRRAAPFVRKQNGEVGPSPQTLAPIGVPTYLLHARLCALPGFEEQYDVHSLENLLAPSCKKPLPLWLVAAIADALSIPFAVLVPATLAIDLRDWEELVRVVEGFNRFSVNLKWRAVETLHDYMRTIDELARLDEAGALEFIEQLGDTFFQQRHSLRNRRVAPAALGHGADD